jgi:hypothetical protein
MSPPSSGSTSKTSKKPVRSTCQTELGLHISPEDGGNIFLQNISLSLNYMALQPKRSYSSKSSLWDPQFDIIKYIHQNFQSIYVRKNENTAATCFVCDGEQTGDIMS